MKIEDIKRKMINYRDYFDQQFNDIEAVKNAKTKKELGDLIDQHEIFLESQITEAQSSLNNFKRNLGL